jgi:hypothetical protein
MLGGHTKGPCHTTTGKAHLPSWRTFAESQILDQNIFCLRLLHTMKLTSFGFTLTKSFSYFSGKELKPFQLTYKINFELNTSLDKRSGTVVIEWRKAAKLIISTLNTMVKGKVSQKSWREEACYWI